MARQASQRSRPRGRTHRRRAGSWSGRECESSHRETRETYSLNSGRDRHGNGHACETHAGSCSAKRSSGASRKTETHKARKRIYLSGTFYLYVSYLYVLRPFMRGSRRPLRAFMRDFDRETCGRLCVDENVYPQGFVDISRGAPPSRSTGTGGGSSREGRLVPRGQAWAGSGAASSSPAGIPRSADDP